MTNFHHLQCIDCQKIFEAISLYKCPNCQGVLVVAYDFNAIDLNKLTTVEEMKKTLVFHDGTTHELMGEGNTPVISLHRLKEEVNVSNLLAKNEFTNPTGSFKDRPVAAGMHKAITEGYDQVIVASSGNGAASVSAYAARFGKKCIVLVPEGTPQEKVKQSLYYGGQIIVVKGPYSNSFNLALEMSEKYDYYNLTTSFINPYTLEGDKAVAYEMHHQTEEWPDYIVVPIGAGPLLVGIYRGFQELNKIYNEQRPLPKMIGVQAEGCSPIVKAYEAGAKKVQAESSPKTIAGGISDGLQGYAEDGTFTLNIIRESNGYCVAVSDEAIIQAQKDLAGKEGIFVEPSAAASYAAIKHPEIEQLTKNSQTMLMLTGHGLKDMGILNIAQENIPTIEPDVKELVKIVNS